MAESILIVRWRVRVRPATCFTIVRTDPQLLTVPNTISTTTRLWYPGRTLLGSTGLHLSSSQWPGRSVPCPSRHKRACLGWPLDMTLPRACEHVTSHLSAQHELIVNDPRLAHRDPLPRELAITKRFLPHVVPTHMGHMHWLEVPTPGQRSCHCDECHPARDDQATLRIVALVLPIAEWLRRRLDGLRLVEPARMVQCLSG